MIRSIWIGEVSNVTNDNTDVLVTLDDGRTFAFTAFTPTNLLVQMDRAQQPFLVCDDLLVVRDLSEGTIRAALEYLLENHDVTRLGVLQQA